MNNSHIALYSLFQEIKAVIFDLDGVIIKSESAWRASERELLLRRGIDVDKTNFQEAQVPFLIGRSQEEAAKVYKKFFNLQEDILSLRQERIKIVKSLFLDVPLMVGVDRVIEFLFNQGFLLGLATSSPIELVEIVFHRFDLYKFFKVVVTAEMVGKGKPDPDIYLETARLLKVEPCKCLVFEDAINGVEAAKSAGMRCIMIPNNFVNNEALEKADWVIKSFLDIDLDKLKVVAKG